MRPTWFDHCLRGFDDAAVVVILLATTAFFRTVFLQKQVNQIRGNQCGIGRFRIQALNQLSGALRQFQFAF